MSNEITSPISEIALGLTDYLSELKQLVPSAKNYADYELNPYLPGNIETTRKHQLGTSDDLG